MFNDNKDIVKAIDQGVAVMRAMLEQQRLEFEFMKTRLATKQDLNLAKHEILKAIGERVDPVAVRKLKEASGELKDALAANQPISGL